MSHFKISTVSYFQNDLFHVFSFVMVESDQEEVEDSKPAATGKKGKKDRKKKKDADLEDAQKELEAIAAGNDDFVQEVGKFR